MVWFVVTDKPAPPYPTVVYVDANAIFGIGPKLDSADLSKLRDLAREAGIELLVPETARLEVLRKFRVAHAEKAAQFASADKALRRSEIVSREPLDFDEQASVSVFADAIAKRFDSVGWRTIDTPDVNVRNLMIRAVEREVPFTEDGKGFRDAVIIETIADEFSKRGVPERLLLVTQNVKDFEPSGLSSRAASAGHTLQITSGFDSAVSIINEDLRRIGKNYVQSDQKTILAFARKHANEIRDYLQREYAPIELGIRGFGENTLMPTLGGWKIDQVLALNIEEPEEVFLNPGVYPDESQKSGRLHFNIAVRVRYTLALSRYAQVSGADATLYRIDLGNGEEELQPVREIKKQRKTEDVERQVLVRASAVGGLGLPTLSNLQLHSFAW